jgi:predicted lipoprotein with Yx(FWY)xxD motif
MDKRWLAPAGLAASALMIAACAPAAATGSAASAAATSSAAHTSNAAMTSGTVLKTRTIGGVTVLTNAQGFTLYWFAPDTPTMSRCNGACATFWPPVKGPATAGPGVTGKLATITREDGTVQATYNGHPLYTYKGDTAPGQERGNNLDVSGGLWHVVPASGGAAPASSQSAGSGGGGYGY